MIQKYLLRKYPKTYGQVLIQYLPAGLHLLLFSFAKSYYTIISYHLMGYVILQYHEQIGYKVDYDDYKDPSAKADEPVEDEPDAAILKEVNLLIQEGKLDEAISG